MLFTTIGQSILLETALPAGIDIYTPIYFVVAWLVIFDKCLASDPFQVIQAGIIKPTPWILAYQRRHRLGSTLCRRRCCQHVA
jgi:hypothetical protein